MACSTAGPRSPPISRNCREVLISRAPDSAARRQALLDRLGLPRYLSAAALLTVVNATLTREEWERLLSAVCAAPDGA